MGLLPFGTAKVGGLFGWADDYIKICVRIVGKWLRVGAKNVNFVLASFFSKRRYLAIMENQPVQDYNQERPKPTGEEFSIEKFDGAEDWNASAWKKIKARDAKKAVLAEYLSKLSMNALDASYSVLNRDKQDPELRDAIAREIECHVDEVGSATT